MMRRLLMAAATAAALAGAGCSGGGDDAAPPSSSTTTSSATETSPAPLTGSDLAACTAYGRIEPKAVEAIDGITQVPASLSARIFGDLADDLDTGVGVADSESLTEPAAKTSAALRAFSSRLEDYRDGDLDLVGEATALYEQSTAVALACELGDPEGTYRAIRADG